MTDRPGVGQSDQQNAAVMLIQYWPFAADQRLGRYGDRPQKLLTLPLKLAKVVRNSRLPIVFDIYKFDIVVLFSKLASLQGLFGSFNNDNKSSTAI